MLNCFENLIGSGLSVHSLNQARLGTKSGGIGLHASKTHSAAAYISSFFMSKSLVETFIATDTNSPYLQNSITAFNTLVSKENQLDASSCPSSQQDLSSKIDFQSFTTLLSSSDALHRARLLACNASRQRLDQSSALSSEEIFMLRMDKLYEKMAWMSPLQF